TLSPVRSRRAFSRSTLTRSAPATGSTPCCLANSPASAHRCGGMRWPRTRVSRQRLNRAEISSRLSPGAITCVVSVLLLIGSAPHQIELADEVNKDVDQFHASLPEGHP